MQHHNDSEHIHTLGVKAARKLATTTKSVPTMETITPRWFCMLLPWVNVVAGTYRVNKRKILIKRDERIDVEIRGKETRLEGRNLRALSLLRDADSQFLEAMASCFAREDVKLGDTISSAKDPLDGFSILAAGKAELSVINPSGKKNILKIVADGGYFGEISPSEESRAQVTAKALAPCLVFTLDRARFEKLLKDDPKAAESFNHVIETRRAALEKVNELGESRIDMRSGHVGEPVIPETFVDYAETPHEYPLSAVQSVLKVHTRVSELYSSPMDQIREQLRLTTLEMKERKEWEVINNPQFGLLKTVAPSQRIQTRSGPPTPDDLDELLTKVWKRPAFFVAHPKAIAAFGRECTRRGVPPPTTMILGSPFLTWRGVPLIPSDSLEINDRSARGHSTASTDILLMRVGEKEQGVVGLRNDALNNEYGHSLSIRFMGIDDRAIASYLISMYFSVAALAEDATASLENVDVGFYHEY